MANYTVTYPNSGSFVTGCVNAGDVITIIYPDSEIHNLVWSGGDWVVIEASITAINVYDLCGVGGPIATYPGGNSVTITVPDFNSLTPCENFPRGINIIADVHGIEEKDESQYGQPPIRHEIYTSTSGSTFDSCAEEGGGTGPTLTCNNPPEGTVGVDYSHVLGITSTGSYHVTLVSGDLPPGLGLDPLTGVINGNPTTEGSYSFTLQITDDTGLSSNVTCLIIINANPDQGNPAPIFLCGSQPPNSAAGFQFQKQLTVTGGTEPVTWKVIEGQLPPGLTLDESSGLISGTFTQAGSYAFKVEVTDSQGRKSSDICAQGVDAPPQMDCGGFVPGYTSTIKVTWKTTPFFIIALPGHELNCDCGALVLINEDPDTGVRLLGYPCVCDGLPPFFESGGDFFMYDPELPPSETFIPPAVHIDLICPPDEGGGGGGGSGPGEGGVNEGEGGGPGGNGGPPNGPNHLKDCPPAIWVTISPDSPPPADHENVVVPVCDPKIWTIIV